MERTKKYTAMFGTNTNINNYNNTNHHNTHHLNNKENVLKIKNSYVISDNYNDHNH